MPHEPAPRMIVRHYLRDHIEFILVVVFIALLVRNFIFATYKVKNDVMEPSVFAGEFFISYRLPYGLRIPVLGTKVGPIKMPRRGDLIVFRSPDPSDEGETQLRRVVAGPGDKIEIKNGSVWINDRSLEYSKSQGRDPRIVLERNDTAQYPILFEGANPKAQLPATFVPPESVFVLSDNRSRTDDSRQYGFVPLSHLDADPVLIWLSFDWNPSSKLPRIRYERIFDRLH